MDQLVWVALLIAAVIGGCVGGAIERGYSRAWERQAQRLQIIVNELHTELESVERRAAIQAGSERVTSPVTVNLHMTAPAQVPSWPRPEMFNAQVIPAIEAT